jgi:hypothetical protein
VTMTLAGPNNGATLTNSAGFYTFCGLVAGIYTVTPGMAGYAFTTLGPIAITTASVTGNNFTSAAVPASTRIVFVPLAPLPSAVVGVAYHNTVVATVTGGQPPYHYQSDTFINGAPPLGMIIDLNGNLTGTPSVAGTYNFGVCAVDTIASSSTPCPAVTVTVLPALTVSLAGTGSGVVTSAPAGITCGATCKAGFATGSSVTLTAAPAAGSTFAGWSGACTGTGSCVVKMSGNTVAVTATFNTVSGTCSNGATDYPTCTPPPIILGTVSPAFVTVGKAGSCTGGSLTGSFSVAANSKLTWTAKGDTFSVGGSSIAVSPAAGSGNGTLNFTITVPPQSPSSAYSNCSLTYDLGSLYTIYVTFSDGSVVAVEVYWTFVGVT